MESGEVGWVGGEVGVTWFFNAYKGVLKSTAT